MTGKRPNSFSVNKSHYLCVVTNSQSPLIMAAFYLIVRKDSMKNVLGIIGLFIGAVLAKTLYKMYPALALPTLVIIGTGYLLHMFWEKKRREKKELVKSKHASPKMEKIINKHKNSKSPDKPQNIDKIWPDLQSRKAKKYTKIKSYNNLTKSVFIGVILLFVGVVVFLKKGEDDSNDRKISKLEIEAVNEIKPLSPKCRKVQLISRALMKSFKSNIENNYTQETINLCISYSFYLEEHSAINKMAEVEGVYNQKLLSIIKNCTNFIFDEGDKAAIFFAAMRDSKIKEFIKYNYEECANIPFLTDVKRMIDFTDSSSKIKKSEEHTSSLKGLSTTCRKVALIDNFSREVVNYEEIALCMVSVVYQMEDHAIDTLAESGDDFFLTFVSNKLEDCETFIRKNGREGIKLLTEKSLEAMKFSEKHAEKCFAK